MKRVSLISGLLPLTAVSLLTGCVDDKYDLSNIDTTSRFTVDNLTVPVNLSEIKLENVVKLDDNDLIEKVMIDGKECYSIVKGGEISPTEFKLGGVHVNAPAINPTNIPLSIPEASPIPIPDLELPAISLPASDKSDYEFNMQNVDKALLALKDVKTKEPIKVEVVLSVPSELARGDNSIVFQNLKLQLPWGLVLDKDNDYNIENGVLTVERLPGGSDGKAHLTLNARGLDLGDKGTVVDQQLSVNGQVGVIGGELKIHVKNTAVPAQLNIRADYNVSAFDIASFSGEIDYKMDDISIAPIALNDLPDFLDSPETNLLIADPQILVSIKNPVGRYNLMGKGSLKLTSNFKNGVKVPYSSSSFTLGGDSSELAFCTSKTGYEYVAFDGLRNVLSNGESGLPSSIEVNIENLNFAGEVTDFPLGDLGSAEGGYQFNAPLAFGAGSRVVYETTEGDWGSDTLDDVNINTIHLKATCTTDLPVSVQLSIVPVDKEGKEIAIKEESGRFEVPAMGKDHPVELSIESLNGRPITGFDGVKFRAIVSQDNPANTSAIGPDLSIILKDIRVTVDGYFEKEL